MHRPPAATDRAADWATGRVSIGAARAPWLITFVDMISLLLTFMVAVYASADIADPVWQPAAAALRAAFMDAPANPSASASVGEAAPPSGLAPGYLALVLGEHLQTMPLLAARPPVYDDDGLRLTLMPATAFSAPTADLEPAAAVEFRRFAAAVAPVANAVAVTVSPDPPAGVGFAEHPSAADWELAVARALAIGRVLADGGLPAARLSLLAGAEGPGGDGIRIVVEAEGRRR